MDSIESIGWIDCNPVAQVATLAGLPGKAAALLPGWFSIRRADLLDPFQPICRGKDQALSDVYRDIAYDL
jgi:hypothetical protein